MVKLEDVYFEHDPRPHEAQCEVSGVTWPEGSSLRGGRAMRQWGRMYVCCAHTGKMQSVRPF